MFLFVLPVGERFSRLSTLTISITAGIVSTTAAYVALLIYLRFFSHGVWREPERWLRGQKFPLPFTVWIGFILGSCFLLTVVLVNFLVKRKRSSSQDAFLAPLLAPLVGAAVLATGGSTFVALRVAPPAPAPQSEIGWAKASGEVPGLILPKSTVEEIVADSERTGEERIEQTTQIANSSVNLSIYNALVSPVVPGTKNVLFNKTRTKVEFYIGTPTTGNVVPEARKTVNPEIAKLPATENLAVSLYCDFCEESKLQHGTITVEPGSPVHSSSAIFQFIPNAERTEKGIGDLVFQVTGTGGTLYDNVVVPVAVETGGAPDRTALAASGANTALGNDAFPDGGRKLDLTIFCQSDGNKIKLQLRPDNPDLALSFNGRQNDGPPGGLKEFASGLTWIDLSTRLLQDYRLLDGIIRQDPILQKAVTGKSTSDMLPQITDLKPQEEQKLLQPMASTGQFLYDGLFNQNQDLKDLISIVEGFKRKDGKPVLIRIVTGGISLPWQFLHPLGSPKEETFWGFKYELIIDPLKAENGFYPGTLHYKNGPMMFGKYHAQAGDPENQLVEQEGEGEIKYLSSDLGFKGLLPAVDSRQSFLDGLNQNRKSLELVIVFTHARNDVVSQPGTKDVTVTQSVSGPELEFRAGEFVSVGSLEDLRNSVEPPDVFRLEQQPLVFLNGCGTGTASFSAMGNRNFPTIFLVMGARGILATEAPVWTRFADDFAQELLKQMKAKDPVSLVLFNARREFLHDHKNPLGLLYTYYGGVDSSLVVE